MIYISYIISIYTCEHVYIYHIFFTHSSVNGLIGCFQIVLFVNSAAVNILISFQTVVLSESMPRSGIAGSYGNSVFNF